MSEKDKLIVKEHLTKQLQHYQSLLSGIHSMDDMYTEKRRLKLRIEVLEQRLRQLSERPERTGIFLTHKEYAKLILGFSCYKCGKSLDDELSVCVYCGYDNSV